jgi:serine/threonine protein kinase
MTPDGDPKVPESGWSTIHSLHPDIADEIQGAINTLRKLQEFAGPSQAPRPPGADGGQEAAGATADGSLVPPAAEADATAVLGAGVAPAAAAEVPRLAAGDTFGRYQVVRLLGQGAMGAVYLAYDAQLQRHVALKTPTLGGSPQTVARFFREARSAAQLRSPYICPVYDVGQIGTIHYLSMAFIDGRPLSRVIAERNLGDGPAVAALVQKIARGVHKAHEQGIIHRDLKPDNIMVDADGEPVVMDFGLARRVDDDVRVTAPGRILGTPAYMSPEQVEGDPAKIGPWSDVYSLGVILYEMLTGRLPFRGSFTAVLRQVVSQEPPRPSAVNPALGEGSPLERICLRLLAKAPADRYASMAEVVQALDEAFPRSPPPATRRSLWALLLALVARLFARRSATGASAGSSSDQTLAGPGSAAAVKKGPTGEQTADFPQAHDSPESVIREIRDGTNIFLENPVRGVHNRAPFPDGDHVGDPHPE